MLGPVCLEVALACAAGKSSSSHGSHAVPTGRTQSQVPLDSVVCVIWLASVTRRLPNHRPRAHLSSSTLRVPVRSGRCDRLLSITMQAPRPLAARNPANDSLVSCIASSIRSRWTAWQACEPTRAHSSPPCPLRQALAPANGEPQPLDASLSPVMPSSTDGRLRPLVLFLQYQSVLYSTLL